MKKLTVVYAILLACLCVSLTAFLRHAAAPIAGSLADSSFYQPSNFPAPVYDRSRNAFNQNKFNLGRRLFYDGILSRNGTISCGTCHVQQSAFSHHGHRLSHGIDDSLGNRNAPALQNLAWATALMWDGAVQDLDLQPIVPITNHVEMAETVANITDKIRMDPVYPDYFAAAYGDRAVTTTRVMQALSQFMLAMVSANSKYDKVMRHEGVSFTPAEAEGYKIFQQRCASCHKEPFFTDFSLRSNGLYPFGPDSGRMGVTKIESDRYKFKVPSLRNIMLTAPYMHDGRFKNIDMVMDHYSSGVQPLPNLDPLLQATDTHPRGIRLSVTERESIKVFLTTLTDSSFVTNPMLSEVNVCPQCIRY